MRVGAATGRRRWRRTAGAALPDPYTGWALVLLTCGSAFGRGSVVEQAGPDAAADLVLVADAGDDAALPNDAAPPDDAALAVDAASKVDGAAQGETDASSCGAQGFQTPTGCQSCATLATKLPIALAEAAAPWGACMAHSDCVRMEISVACGGECSFALAQEHTATGKSAVQQSAAGFCGEAAEPCPITCLHDGTPACIDGQCALVDQCDPALVPAGSPCDDGNPCTIGDYCVGTGYCWHAGSLCDDGNVCTDDTCSATGECSYTPSWGSCPTTAPCGLDASCAGGQCIDGGATGWRKALALPASDYWKWLARAPDGSYFIGFSVLESCVYHAFHVDAAGTILWSQPLKCESLSGLMGLADGTALFAGVAKAAVPGHTVISHFNAIGVADQSTEIPVFFVADVEMTPRSAGGYVAAGVGYDVATKSRHAYLARVNADGLLLGVTDLGNTAAKSTALLLAGHGTTYGVLTDITQPDGSTQVRFVRVDDAGVVQINVPLYSIPANYWPRGLIAMTDGFMGIAGNSALNSWTSMAPGSVAFRVTDQGDLVWQESVPVGNLTLRADGNAGLTVGVTDQGTPLELVHIQQISPDGTLIGMTTYHAGQMPMAGGAWDAAGGGSAMFLAPSFPSGDPLDLVHVNPSFMTCVP